MKNSLAWILFGATVVALIVGVPPITVSGEPRPESFVEPTTLPKTMILCGEPMPLENQAVREMLDREVQITIWDRAKVLLTLKRAGRYFPYLEKRLAELRMPDDLKYLSVAESNLLTYAKSSQGALGPWQFMQATGSRVGLRYDSSVDERLDFERATEAALSYLRELREMFGSWAAAMAAYNCGENRIRTEMYEQRVTDYYRLDLPQETERYVFRIAAIKLIMENPAKYGYRISKEHLYAAISCDTAPVDIRFPVHIADLAQALGTDYKTIKELNPQILGRHLPLGQYTLKVPCDKGPILSRFLKSLPPPEEVSQEEPKSTYTVKQGETLTDISRRTGVPLETLKRLNGLDSRITPGQRLRLGQ